MTRLQRIVKAARARKPINFCPQCGTHYTGDNHTCH